MTPAEENVSVCWVGRMGGAFGCGGNTRGNAFHEENSMSYPDAEKNRLQFQEQMQFWNQAYKKLEKKCVDNLEQNCGCFSLQIKEFGYEFVK